MVHGDNWVSSELYDVFKKMFGVTGLPHIILLGLNWGGSTLACRDCQDLIDDLFPEYKGISFPPYAEWTLPKRYIIRKQKAIMDEEEFGASKIHWLENVELEYLRRKNVVSIAFKLIPLKGDYWTGGGIYKVLKDPVVIDRIVQALLKADPHDHDRITDSCLGIVMLLAFEDNTGIVTAFTPFVEQFVNVAVVSKRTYGAVRVSEELFDIYETLFGSLKDRGTPGPYTEEARQKWLEKQARKKQEEI
jgi:hypothetical protein